jgi:hypothetical protein
LAEGSRSATWRINSDDPDENPFDIPLSGTGVGIPCTYTPGDVNGSDSYNGLDVTYGVSYLKGGPDPTCPVGSCPIPPCDAFFYCGDVNGSCSYNGLDITYGVAYLKGGPALIYCPDCPPSGIIVASSEKQIAEPMVIKESKVAKKGVGE